MKLFAYYAYLLAFLNMVWAETIERNVGVLAQPVSCVDQSTACVINCNVVNSCRATTINCGSADNCIINLNANYAAYGSTIIADGIVSLTINAANANYAFQTGTLQVGTLSGDLSITSTGSGLGSFHNCDVTVGSIGGDLLVEETPNSAAGRSFKYIDISVTGAIGGSATFAARNDNGRTDYQAFDLAKIKLNSVGGDAVFISNMYGTFSENLIVISGDVAGNVEFTDTSTYGRGFCCSPASTYGISVLGTISGNVVITDDSTDGYGGYNTDFVFGDVLGDVVVTSSSLHSYEATSWTFGDIGGSMSFSAAGNTLQAFQTCEVNVGNIGGELVMEETPDTSGSRGRSFKYLDLTVSGNVGGGARFQSHVDNGRLDYQTFDLSSIIIEGSVGGDAQFLSNMFGSFSECKVQIGGDIAGNVDIVDTSTYGRGFCCNPGPSLGFYFLGTVSGDVNILDDSTDGHAGYNTDFKFVNVLGNVNIISSADGPYAYHSAIFQFDSVSGYLEAKDMTTSSSAIKAFDHTTWTLGSVGQHLLFQSVNDFGTVDAQPFDVSTFSIGSVGGDCTFNSGTFGTFSECDITIGEVSGTTTFVGSASHGYDFYNTDIDITTCSTVLYRTDNQYAMYLLDSVFGSGVGLVDIAVNGGTPHALHAATFDAREADEVMMNCYEDGDCSDFKIYCPEDNQANKCKVYCGADATCTNIDLFTTNGYCEDATFYCHDATDPTNCDLTTANQVYCTTGTTYNYGVAGTYCNMQKDIVNDYLYCNDVGSAQCSTEANCAVVTPEPTPKPTTAAPTQTPTTSKPTASPTPRPTTKAPSDAPTAAPTFEPCTNVVETYNVQFTLDESGSVLESNYINSIQFVQNLIQNDVSPNSKAAVLSFGTSNDEVYAFTQDQSSRSAVLSDLETEKSDYANAYTDTYNALLQVFAQFDADSDITSGDNNMVFLMTDGKPSCKSTDVGCVTQICSSDTNKEVLLTGLSQRGITLYLLGIGDFDQTEIECLTDNIYRIQDFTPTEFKTIEAEFRTILCPETPQARANMKALPLSENNGIDFEQFRQQQRQRFNEKENEMNKFYEENRKNDYNDYNHMVDNDRSFENQPKLVPLDMSPFLYGAVGGMLLLCLVALCAKMVMGCCSNATHQYKSVAINSDSEALV